jgi:hypothetical protein
VLFDVEYGFGDFTGTPAQFFNLNFKILFYSQGLCHGREFGIGPDDYHHMEAGYTHKMGIGKVYQGKAGMEEIKGPGGGGHIPAVDLGGKGIKVSHGINKIFYFSSGPAAAVFKEKAQGPYPEIHKIKIYVYPAGLKGNFLIQAVIHRSKGNKSRIPHRPVLEKEKI